MTPLYVLSMMNNPGWQLFCGPQYWYLTRKRHVKVVPQEVATALLREGYVHLFDVNHGEYLLTNRGIKYAESTAPQWFAVAFGCVLLLTALSLITMVMMFLFRK